MTLDLPRPLADLINQAVKAHVREHLPAILVWAIEQEQTALLAHMTQARRLLQLPTWAEASRWQRHVAPEPQRVQTPPPPSPFDVAHPGWRQARVRKAVHASGAVAG